MTKIYGALLRKEKNEIGTYWSGFYSTPFPTLLKWCFELMSLAGINSYEIIYSGTPSGKSVRNFLK